MGDETAGGMPSNIINVVLALLVIIVWIFLIRLFVYPRFSQDPFILASALCFAVSVPCLATMVLLITAAINGETEQEWSVPVEWISAIGEVAFYAGISSVFFHYHWGAAVAFLVTSSLVAYIGWAQRKPYVTSEEERPGKKHN